MLYSRTIERNTNIVAEFAPGRNQCLLELGWVQKWHMSAMIVAVWLENALVS